VLVTLQRYARARDYFGPERFAAWIEETAVHELAINPNSFTRATIVEEAFENEGDQSKKRVHEKEGPSLR
jgi:hypothetical protein